MTWALQWSATGDLVERDGAPLLFADDCDRIDKAQRQGDFFIDGAEG